MEMTALGVCKQNMFPLAAAIKGRAIARSEEMHNSTFSTMLIMKKIVSLICLLMTAVAFSGMDDKVLRFSTPGPDRYADGSRVLDGECYALVWSPKGSAFAGFNADGTAVSANDRVVLAAPLAKDGKCRDAIFQIPAAEYEELKGGEWAVCLVDTRKPLRVNRWGLVQTGVTVEEPSKMTAAAKSNRMSLAAAGGTRSVASDGGLGATALSVRANNLSAVPPNLAPPQITAIEIADGEVWLGVKDTVPYLSYTIVSGSEPGNLKTDYFAETVDGEDGAEIAIGTVKSPARRFFKVKRAE